MFRRRTLTSVDLSSSPTVGETNQLSASSPSSPLQHQQQQLTHQQTKNPPTVVGNTLSVPAHGYAGTSASSTSLPTSPLSLSPSPSVIAVGSPSCATNKAASSSPNTSNNFNYMQHHTSFDSSNSGAMSLSTSINHHHHQQHHQNHQQQQHHHYSTTSSSVTTTSTMSTGRISGTCGGVGVLPGAFNGRTTSGGGVGSGGGGYFASNKDKLGNSTVGLLARDTKLKSTGTDSSHDLETNREMTDSQRSLSEGRLVDSDFTRDGLSQSHDSVFSESATASSLSIVLKAELADVLRKRRNRPDASDEDLGLPRSPTTPQRRETTNTTNQSDVSSLSMLSMNSTIEFDDELPSSTANHSGEFSSAADRTSSSISSKISGGENSRSDDVELFSSDWTRLSHSAAKHKMAVRPVKKKGPTRHRRTLESSVLPSTPEVNEDQPKTTSNLEVKGISLDKAKSRSLPPGVNAKALEQHSTEVKQAVSIKRSKTEKGPSPNASYAVRSTATKSSIFESVTTTTTQAERSPTESNKDDESGFFRRFVYRNSKRGASKSTTANNSGKIADELDSQPESKKPNPSPTVEKPKSIDTKSAEYSKKVEETRKDIRRDILSTGNSALSAMLNTFILSPESEKMVTHATNENVTLNPTITAKPKSGPAARQRYIPKDLSQQQHQPTTMDIDLSAKHTRTSIEISEKEDYVSSNPTTQSRLSKSYTEESFKSATLVREVNSIKDLQQHKEHFEKKPKILGMSAFQQKMSRSNDSFNTSSSTDSVDLFLGSDLRKRGKSVEKSKSFRTYIESKEDKEIPSLRNQVPSLPDLSQKTDNDLEDEKHLSLGFEINDNNLVKQKSSELPLTHGIYTKNIILTTSKNMPSRIQTKSPLLSTSPCSTSISEIEQNIDMLVKSPFVSVIRKSATISDSVASKLAPNVTITSIPSKRNDSIAKVENKIDRILRSEDKDLYIPPATTPAAPPPTPATPPPTLVAPTITHSPTKVTLREKPIKISADVENRKSMRERNSSPQTPTSTSSKSNSFNRSRRSSSVIETTSASNGKSTAGVSVGVPEFMKIQLNRVDPIRPKSNVVLSKNVRDNSEDLTRRFSNESVEINETKPPTPPIEDDKPTIMIRSNSTTSNRSEESLPRSPTKKTPDEENNILRIETNSAPLNNNIPLHERRRLFLSEDKIKSERKIEEIKLERKKSMSEEVRKMPTEEEPIVVVLRKKSFGVIQPSANNNKDDPTPELMKVFARRSLKIKDDDLPDPPIKKFVPSVDSDKENQSSSEEKLDKLSSIQQQQNGLPKTDTDITKNRNSLADFRINKPQTLNNNGIGTPTKSFLPPIRLSGPFRQASQGSPILTSAKTIDSTTNNNNNNNNSLTNNNNHNNNLVTKPMERQSIATSVPPSVVTSVAEQNNFSTSSSTFSRATIERSATMATMNRVESEFKGIHQRRAEWEKRAKEALK